MCSGGGRDSAAQEPPARREWMQVSEAEPVFLQQVSLHKDAACPEAPVKPVDYSCTVFLRNLPVRCKEEEVIYTLTELGWGGDIGSVSLPLRPAKPGRAHHNRGYGFVYFNNLLAARAFLDAMVDGLRISTRSSSKVVLVEHIRGSRSQEDSIPDLKGVDKDTGSSSFATQAPIVANWTGWGRLVDLATIQSLQL